MDLATSSTPPPSEDMPAPSDAELTATRPICRVSSYTGLAQRRVPLDAAVIPKALTFWCAGVPSNQLRAATHAPAIYLVPGEEGHRLIHESHSDPSAFASATHRIRLCERYRAAPGGGPGDLQRLLHPRQVNLIGHLLTAIKYPDYCLDLGPHPREKDRVELHLRPGALIKHRLDRQICGSAYDQLESDLALLAQTMVVIQRRAAPGVDEWEDLIYSPLVEHLETGRRRLLDGYELPVATDQGKTGHEGASNAPRRHRTWRLSLGHGLAAMLRTVPSDLCVISSPLWNAATRDVSAQWLALYLSGSGYDGTSRMHPHRLTTLAERMRLYPDKYHAVLVKEGVLRPTAEKPSLIDRAGDWRQLPNGPAKPTVGSSKQLADTARPAISALRQAIQRITRSVARLEQRGAIAQAEMIPAIRPSDIAPSQIGRRLSLFDQLTCHRWSAEVEALLTRHAAFWSDMRSDLISTINDLAIYWKRKLQLPQQLVLSKVERLNQHLQELTAPGTTRWHTNLSRFRQSVRLGLERLVYGATLAPHDGRSPPGSPLRL